MVLQSQVARSSMSRSYMVSRRRKARLWPWMSLVVVGLLAGGLYYWIANRGDAAAAYADGTSQQDGTLPPDGPGLVADERDNRQREQAARPDTAVTISRSAPGSLGTPGTTGTTGTTGPATTATTSEPAQPTTTAGTPVTSEPAPRSGSTVGATTSRDGGQSINQSPAELRHGMNLIADGDFVEGRQVLSRLLFDRQRPLSAADRHAVRETLTSINQKLIFSPDIVQNDPVALRYRVQRGDRLIRIAPQYKLTYQFIERINNISANHLQADQNIKLIRGPFHARVIKHEYLMDVYVNNPQGQPVYVCSFPVGLGEEDSTPEGKWVVEPGRKVQNPSWRNPRTGEFFAANDPTNPIGKYWIALKGAEDRTQGLQGYGIHGTIEPDSVGQQMSMGCIRLRDGDIDLLYMMLVEDESMVEILP